VRHGVPRPAATRLGLRLSGHVGRASKDESAPRPAARAPFLSAVDGAAHTADARLPGGVVWCGFGLVLVSGVYCKGLNKWSKEQGGR